MPGVRSMKRLTLVYNGKEVVSNPFSMGAFRAVFDTLMGAEELTPGVIDTAAFEGVIRLFDGTELTEEIIRRGDGIDASGLLNACALIISWYRVVAVNPGNREYMGESPKTPILSLYKQLLKEHDILPDEIERQDPQLFFSVMNAEDFEKPDPSLFSEIPDEYRAF